MFYTNFLYPMCCTHCTYFPQDFSKISQRVLLTPSLGPAAVIDILESVTQLHCDWKAPPAGSYRVLNGQGCCTHCTEVQLAPLPVGLPHRGITDSSWLQENLFCVVNNAVKFSKAAVGGVLVAVTYDKESYMLEINVRDSADLVLTGAQLQRLFEAPVLIEPNHRGRQNVGGMGLGMFCLSERVKALGGECGARVRTDDKHGTEVWFKVPFPPAPDTEFVLPVDEEREKKDESTRKPDDGYEDDDDFDKYDIHLHGVYKSFNVQTEHLSQSQSQPQTPSHSPRGAMSISPKTSHLPIAEMRKAHSAPPRAVKWSSDVDDGFRMIAVRDQSLQSIDRDLTHVGSAEDKPLLGIHALVVDDSIPILKVVSIAIKSKGAIVTTATDGEEAVKKFQVGYFGLVVTDIQMPVLGGMEATEQMRAFEAESGRSGTASRAVIIGMSANANRAACLDAGMDDFLPKPFSVKELLDSYAMIKKLRTILSD
jgi:CheY-like chemotaxis protein